MYLYFYSHSTRNQSVRLRALCSWGDDRILAGFDGLGSYPNMESSFRVIWPFRVMKLPYSPCCFVRKVRVGYKAATLAAKFVGYTGCELLYPIELLTADSFSLRTNTNL